MGQARRRREAALREQRSGWKGYLAAGAVAAIGAALSVFYLQEQAPEPSEARSSEQAAPSFLDAPLEALPRNALDDLLEEARRDRSKRQGFLDAVADRIPGEEQRLGIFYTHDLQAYQKHLFALLDTFHLPFSDAQKRAVVDSHEAGWRTSLALVPEMGVDELRIRNPPIIATPRLYEGRSLAAIPDILVPLSAGWNGYRVSNAAEAEVCLIHEQLGHVADAANDPVIGGVPFDSRLLNRYLYHGTPTERDAMNAIREGRAYRQQYRRMLGPTGDPRDQGLSVVFFANETALYLEQLRIAEHGLASGTLDATLSRVTQAFLEDVRPDRPHTVPGKGSVLEFTYAKRVVQVGYRE